jgi:hypothetical protein
LGTGISSSSISTSSVSSPAADAGVGFGDGVVGVVGAGGELGGDVMSVLSGEVAVFLVGLGDGDDEDEEGCDFLVDDEEDEVEGDAVGVDEDEVRVAVVVEVDFGPPPDVEDSETVGDDNVDEVGGGDVEGEVRVAVVVEVAVEVDEVEGGEVDVAVEVSEAAAASTLAALSSQSALMHSPEVFRASSQVLQVATSSKSSSSQGHLHRKNMLLRHIMVSYTTQSLIYALYGALYVCLGHKWVYSVIIVYIIRRYERSFLVVYVCMCMYVLTLSGLAQKIFLWWGDPGNMEGGPWKISSRKYLVAFARGKRFGSRRSEISCNRLRSKSVLVKKSCRHDLVARWGSGTLPPMHRSHKDVLTSALIAAKEVISWLLTGWAAGKYHPKYSIFH